MCSLSWYHRQNEYEVFFNRDEKKTRGRALPPRLSETNGVRYLCPKDADAGGTWLLANEYGVTLALLNYWGNTPQPSASLSRGRLVSEVLAAETSATSVMERLSQTSLKGYASFTLAAFDLSLPDGPLVMRWTGQSLSTLPPEMPLCSSSFLPDEVIASRQQLFQNLPDHEAETLWKWHTEEAAPSAYTVRMNRPDAQTWSSSRVLVTASDIHWRYIEEMPGLSQPSQSHELKMKR
jgi:Transport and Golgi organisation 2